MLLFADFIDPTHCHTALSHSPERAPTKGFANIFDVFTAFNARVYSLALSNGWTSGSTFFCCFGMSAFDARCETFLLREMVLTFYRKGTIRPNSELWRRRWVTMMSECPRERYTWRRQPAAGKHTIVNALSEQYYDE